MAQTYYSSGRNICSLQSILSPLQCVCGCLCMRCHLFLQSTGQLWQYFLGRQVEHHTCAHSHLDTLGDGNAINLSVRNELSATSGSWGGVLFSDVCTIKSHRLWKLLCRVELCVYASVCTCNMLRNYPSHTCTLGCLWHNAFCVPNLNFTTKCLIPNLTLNQTSQGYSCLPLYPEKSWTIC